MKAVVAAKAVHCEESQMLRQLEHQVLAVCPESAGAAGIASIWRRGSSLGKGLVAAQEGKSRKTHVKGS